MKKPLCQEPRKCRLCNVKVVEVELVGTWLRRRIAASGANLGSMQEATTFRGKIAFLKPPLIHTKLLDRETPPPLICSSLR